MCAICFNLHAHTIHQFFSCILLLSASFASCFGFLLCFSSSSSKNLIHKAPSILECASVCVGVIVLLRVYRGAYG